MNHHRILVHSPSVGRNKYSVTLSSSVSDVVAARLEWIRFYDGNGKRVNVFDDRKLPYLIVQVDPFEGVWKRSPDGLSQSSFAVVDREDYVPSSDIDPVTPIGRVSKINVVLHPAFDALQDVAHTMAITIYTSCKGT